MTEDNSRTKKDVLDGIEKFISNMGMRDSEISVIIDSFCNVVFAHGPNYRLSDEENVILWLFLKERKTGMEVTRVLYPHLKSPSKVHRMFFPLVRKVYKLYCNNELPRHHELRFAIRRMRNIEQGKRRRKQ